MRPEVLLALVTVCAAYVPAAYNQYQQSTGHWWPSAQTERAWYADRRDSGESDGRQDNSGEAERWQPARRGHLSHRQVGAMIGGIATGRRLPVQQQWPRADSRWSSGGRRQQQDSTEDRWTGRTTQDSGERTGYGTNQYNQQGERGRGDDSQERSDAYITRQTPYWRGRYQAEQQRSEPLRRAWGGQDQDSGEDQTRRSWGGQDQNSGEDQTRRSWGAQDRDDRYGQDQTRRSWGAQGQGQDSGEDQTRRSWGAQGQDSGDSNEQQNPYSWGRQGRDGRYGQGQDSGDSGEDQTRYNWGAQRQDNRYGQGGDSGDSGEQQTRTRHGAGGRHTSVWPTDDSNSNENGRQGDSWLNWFG